MIVFKPGWSSTDGQRFKIFDILIQDLVQDYLGLYAIFTNTDKPEVPQYLFIALSYDLVKKFVQDLTRLDVLDQLGVTKFKSFQSSAFVWQYIENVGR